MMRTAGYNAFSTRDVAASIDIKAASVHYADALRTALVRDAKLCLCAVLGAEIGGLPPEVAASARVFFERNLEWLTVALNNHGKRGIPAARTRATLVLASLEGAMILSNSLADQAVFERVVRGLLPTLEK